MVEVWAAGLGPREKKLKLKLGKQLRVRVGGGLRGLGRKRLKLKFGKQLGVRVGGRPRGSGRKRLG